MRGRTAARLLGGILLGCVALEVQLRLTENGRPWKRPFAEDGALLLQRPATTYDPHTRFRFTPGWTGRFFFAGDAASVGLQANALGFRSPDYAIAKDAGVLRVALLGDSMVAGLQVEEHAHARARLEALLRAEGPAEVLNFGLPGTGPVSTLEVYREFARVYRPDAVVIGVYTDNDFDDDADTPWRAADGSVVSTPFADAPGDVGKFLKANSCVVMAAWALTRDRRAEHATPAAPEEPAAASTFALASVSEAAYANALAVWDELGTEIVADGAVPIVVLFPDRTTRGDAGWDYARPATRELHRRLAERFRARGVRVVAGEELLRRHRERAGDVPFAGWKSYLSAAGHETLAGVLAERVRTRPAS